MKALRAIIGADELLAANQTATGWGTHSPYYMSYLCYHLEPLLDLPGAVAISLQGLKGIQTTVDIVQKLFTIAAIVGGAIWTYFNFFRGRTYRKRLEPEVSGKVLTLNGSSHLLATMSLKNVGLSRVEIEQRGSALQVFSYSSPLSEEHVVTAQWEELTAFPVFESHQWIEPGESVKEERLIAIPTSGRTAFQLQLRVVATKKLGSSALAIVTLNGENAAERRGGEDGRANTQKQ